MSILWRDCFSATKTKSRASRAESLRHTDDYIHSHTDTHAQAHLYAAHDRYASRHAHGCFVNAKVFIRPGIAHFAELHTHAKSRLSKRAGHGDRATDGRRDDDRLSNGCSDRYANVDTDKYSDVDRNPNRDANHNRHRYTNGNAYRNAYTDIHTHRDSHAMTQFPILSVVIPVYNEERRLEKTLDACFRYLPHNFSSWELIVVDDGSTDGTWRVLEQHRKIFNHFTILRNPHKGKGHAVKTGMLFAKGEYRLFMDCDLSTPLTEIIPAMRAIRNADIVIGSREIDRAKVKAALSRRLMGRIFHMLVSDLVDGIRDTQCGFKSFRDYAAQDCFRDQMLDGMAFDVELLYLALRKGYVVNEMPVAWTHDPDSRVRVVGDSLQMLRDVINIPALHKSIMVSSP